MVRRRFRPILSSACRAVLLAVLTLTLLAGCTTSEETDADASLLPMTVVEWLFPPGADYAEADPLGVAQIAWDPMRPGENTIAVTLSGLQGDALPLVDEASELAIDVRRLAPDTESMPLTPERDGATWTAENVELSEIGWYQLDIRLVDGDEPVTETRTWTLLPDPSVYGAGAVELPEPDPDAQALYERAMEAYGSWEAVRWRESLSSVAGAVVVSEFAVTDRANEPTAMLMNSRFAGSFLPREDGSAPAPPRLDFAVRITIGERLWPREDDGSWSVRATRPPRDL